MLFLINAQIYDWNKISPVMLLVALLRTNTYPLIQTDQEQNERIIHIQW